jgi:propionate CoA-transferase
MMELAATDRIEAYAMPAGVISALFRECAARRPGLFTRTGLRTFADPRLNGCRINASASEPLVELIDIDGREYLHYAPFHVDVALVRGTVADAAGNIGARDEAALLDAFDIAASARACNGLVIAQVRATTAAPLDPREVTLPAALIDAVVVAPDQQQTYAGTDPGLFEPVEHQQNSQYQWRDPARTLIAFRAADEVESGSILNLGFGVSSDVAPALDVCGRLDDVGIVIEQGLFGGIPSTGDLFGSSKGPSARISSTSQFDLFAGGIIDVTCLGMAQVDARGNVNVSRFGGRVIGPGGFVDISQYARKAIFCGSFTAGGIRVAVDGDAVTIQQEGRIRKFVNVLDEVTYSGDLAAEEGREALYVTERAVFRSTPEGLALTEIAPGVDLQRDILDQMDFDPIIDTIRPMPTSILKQVAALVDVSDKPVGSSVAREDK